MECERCGNYAHGGTDGSGLCDDCARNDKNSELSSLRSRLALAERVAEAARKASEAAKSYKEGGLPLRERGPNWAVKIEALRDALRAYDAVLKSAGEAKEG